MKKYDIQVLSMEKIFTEQRLYDVSCKYKGWLIKFHTVLIKMLKSEKEKTKPICNEQCTGWFI